MNIQQHEHPNALPKQKRIKVSKACYTCRVKKIKCDGLNPCMQCKARQRPCSFSADGMGDPNYPIRHSLQTPTTISPANSSSPPSLSPRQSISALNYSTPSTTSIVTYEKRLLDSISLRLESLGQSWPGCEYEDIKSNSNGFNTCSYQQQRSTTQPPLSFFLLDLSKPQNNDNILVGKSIVSPETRIQHNLITLYYYHRYRLLPLLPKSTLFSLIHHPSPKAFISPLLLCTLYAHGAQSSPTTSSDADRHATTAKSMLDDYLDEPQISTVIALVLLALYESNRNGYSCSPCQSSIYSAMAFRMCLDLNLHHCNDTTYDSQHCDKLIIKALQLRVFWCCYCLDKWQSLYTDHPWMMHGANISKNMEIDGKSLLDMEDSTMDHNEQMVMEGLVASIQLAQLGETLLQQSSSSSFSGFQADQQLLPFLQRLPASLHWTPLPTPESLSSPASSLYQPVPSHPPHNGIVGHFHLIFNLLHLTLLVRSLLEMESLSSHYDLTKKNEHVNLVLQRCSTVATNLTQLTCALTDQTGFILSYRMVANALMVSVRVHLIQCYSVMQPTGNEQHRVAKHARLMFQRSLRSLRILVQHRVIPGSDTFVASVEKTLETLTLSPQGNNNYTSANHSNISPPNTNDNQQRGSGVSSMSSPYQSQQRNDYLSGAEQSAAEILSNTFNINTYMNNNSNATKPITPSKPVQSPPRITSVTQATSQSEKQQHQPLVDVAALYTSATSNPLYHQQILPHFGYSLPSGKHDEVWVLQEQYQQHQQRQEQEQKQPSASSPTSSSLTYMTSSLWSSSSSSSSTHTEKKSQKATTSTRNFSPMPSTSSPTTKNVPASSATPSGMTSPPPYKSFGLGVYASAHRHHSDVISQHYPGKNETVIGNGSNKMDHRPVILNHHGQVLVTSSSESPSALVDISPSH